MGLFFINRTEEEKRENERQKADELKELADEAMKLVENAPNEIFPDFLWSPQINEFEMMTDYRTKAACTNAAVLRAYTIGRKYTNYWLYLDAMEAYTEYAKYIDSVFGSFEMMARANQDGYSSVFIPPKPKLSHKKKNKLLIETGFMPSRVEEKFEMPDEAIEEQIAQTQECELSFEDCDPPEYIKKIQEAMVGTKAKTDRLAGIFRYNSDNRNAQGMDAIVAFITGSTNEVVKDADSGYSLSEQIDELHEFDGIPEDIIEHMLLPDAMCVVRDGIFQNQREREITDIIRTLEMNGFDFLGSTITRGMKNEAIRALHREFGADVDLSKMSKKQRKKFKRRQKEMEADRRNALAGDRRLQRTLLASRVHLTRDECDDFGVDQSLANFHLSDVIPDDDWG